MIAIRFAILFYMLLFLHTIYTADYTTRRSPLHYLYPRESLIDGDPIPPTKTMLVFLDENEQGVFNPVTAQYLTALHQKGNYCILASFSLFKTILATQNRAATLTAQSLPQELGKFSSDPTTKGQISILYTMASTWDHTSWDIYAVNKSLLLFVPASYRTASDMTLGIDRSTLAKFTYDEKLQHLLFPSIVTPSTTSKEPKKRSDLITDVRKALDTCFIKRLTYQQTKQLKNINQWAFYIFGHGASYAMAGMSFSECIEVLQFFDSKILTRLVCIVSCYAGGENRNKIQNSYRQGSKTPYTFPIVIGGIGDEAAGMLYTNKITPGTSPAKFIIDYDHQFAVFSASIDTEQPISYLTALQPILGDFEHYTEQRGTILTNYPILQPAGRTDFMPLFASITIGDILAGSRTKPLSIAKAWKSLRENVVADLPFVIISSNHIPFELDLRHLSKQGDELPLCKIVIMRRPSTIHLQALRFDMERSKHILTDTIALFKATQKSVTARITIEALYLGTEDKPTFTDINYFEEPFSRDAVIAAVDSKTNKNVMVTSLKPQNIIEMNQAQIDMIKKLMTKTDDIHASEEQMTALSTLEKQLNLLRALA